jgi:hypothetical protein
VFFVIARASNPRRRNAIFDVSDGDFALEINHQRDRQKVIPFSFSRSARRGPKHTAHTHHVRKFQRAFSPGRRTAMKSIFPRNIQLNQTHYVRQLQKNDTMPALENTF